MQHFFEKVNEKYYNKGVVTLSKSELHLVRLLAEKIGIKTAVELEEFKKQTNANTNNLLLKRLAMFVATGITFKEVAEYKRIFNKA